MEKRDDIMQFFTHLPTDTPSISKMFADLAEEIHATVPRNAERTSALRKLLEALDSTTRAINAK
jgi:hypothetical protein